MSFQEHLQAKLIKVMLLGFGQVIYSLFNQAPSFESLSIPEQQAIAEYCHYRNIGSDRIETLVPDYKTRVYLRDNYCTKL